MRARDDEGMTLVEVLVSLGIIGAMLLSTTVYFVGSLSLTRYQNDRQSAAQLATDAMDRMRALTPAAIVQGRDAVTVAQQKARVTAAGVLATALAGMETVADPAAVAGAGRTAAAVLPTIAQAVPAQRGVAYTQEWYVGRCWIGGVGGSCALGNAVLPDPVALLRVVVAVRWTGKDCTASSCVFVTSTLVNEATADPLLPPVPTVPPVTTPPTTNPPVTTPPTTAPPAVPAPAPLPAAIWANRSTGGAVPAAFSASGSLLTIVGVVHSNADVFLDQSMGSVSPRIEYGTTYTKPPTSMLTTPAPVKVAPSQPDVRDPARYRPGGAAAVAAGSGYRAVTCSGTWTFSAAAVGSASVVYVPCDVVLSQASINLKALLVAEGTITITGSAVTVGDPADAYRTGLVSNSAATPAITVGGSLTKIYGNVQAVRGGVVINGSATTLRCGVIGDTVTVNGSATTITVDEGCTG